MRKSKRLIVLILLMMLIGSKIFCQTKINKGSIVPYTGILFSESEEKKLQQKILLLERNIEMLKNDIVFYQSTEEKRLKQLKLEERIDNSLREKLSFMETFNKLNLFGKIKFRFFQIGFVCMSIAFVGLVFWELGNYANRYYMKNY